ncbi:MAG: cupin domain-containing protein [Oscillospiraceae bacterium]|nr:cupin domain-containing protein [Oscillospiraceae bacterium]
MVTTADRGRLITCRIRKGSSDQIQRHAAVEDMNYVISGTGKAICNGTESIISAGGYLTFKSGSNYSIKNTGDEDLVLLSFVKEA